MKIISIGKTMTIKSVSIFWFHGKPLKYLEDPFGIVIIMSNKVSQKKFLLKKLFVIFSKLTYK